MELKDMDLGTGEETDRQKAVTGALTDESLISAEFVFACEDTLFAGDSVFSEKHEFKIEGKVDLSAVKMP